MSSEAPQYLQAVLTKIDEITQRVYVVENDLEQLRARIEKDIAPLLLAGQGGTPEPGWLAVPWIGQNVRDVATDDYSSSDCGPACVAMWLTYRGKTPTVDDVSKATGLSAGFT